MKNKTSVLYGMVIGAILAALLATIVGMGIKHEWPADHWGPLSAWVSSLLTAGAVIVALVSANRATRTTQDAEVDRLIDHELSRRREVIEVISELWGEIDSVNGAIGFYLDDCDTYAELYREDASEAIDSFQVKLATVHTDVLKAWVKYSSKRFAADVLTTGGPIHATIETLTSHQSRVLDAHWRHSQTIASDPTMATPDELRNLIETTKAIKRQHLAVLQSDAYRLDRDAARTTLQS